MENKLTIEEINSLIERFPNSTVSNMAAEILEFRDGKQLDGKQLLDMVTTPVEPNPHTELIVQYEQDKIDYPDFFEKLSQYKSPHYGWITLDKLLNDPFLPSIEHRRHPLRESIIAWHACSDEDKKRWQWLFKSDITKRTEWINLNGKTPDWFDDVEYRIRPRTCQVTLQDGTVMEYPEPVREQLEIWQELYFINVFNGTVGKVKWYENKEKIECLKNGRYHLTEQAAQQHLKVLQAINNQVAL